MNLPPIRRQVVVPAATEAAFDAFTERMAAWWPLGSHSVHGAEGTVGFREGRLIETGPDGDECVWGTVLAWEPPHRLRMTWHPGRDAAAAGEVEVAFAPVGDEQTLVTITHSGWQTLDARVEYRSGWPVVLANYEQIVSAEPDKSPERERTFVLALSHTPGPDGVRQPGFQGHLEFLRTMSERGLLVAAGPFPGTDEGMTLLRVPASQVADVVRAAHFEDAAVAEGILEVHVRPWVVASAGVSLG